MIGRRERKREQTKQSLMNAAINLLITTGFEDTTIDDIVAAADVAKVTFYYYFKSKEEILFEIKEQCTQQVLSRAEALLAQQAQASEILQALITDIGHWTEKNWQLLNAFASQRFGPMTQTKTCGSPNKPIRFVLLLEQIIKLGQRTGQFRKDIDPGKVAHFLMLAIMHEQFTWIKEGRKRSTLIGKIQNCLDFAVNGIARKK